MIWPPVINCATPLPATIKINVATMGWTLNTVTSSPFQHPHTMAAARALTMTNANGTWAMLINWAATAPAIAITAPTDRSTPLVAMTSGVDLSVGAVMAIAGAVAAQLINMAQVPFALVIVSALAAAIVCGCWNGLLVTVFKVQPIVATLILMVAGRGVAQLITGGQIITFTHPGLTYLGNGHCLA